MPISIKYSFFNKDNVPIIKDEEIEDFINKQLLEYNDHHFDKPHALDIESFVEFYIGKCPNFYKLSLDEDKQKKLGITALSDGKIMIYRNNKPDYVEVQKGDIFIDSSIENKEHLFRFTLAHEAGHSVLHTKCSFNIVYAEDYSNSIKYGEHKKLITVSDWIDHHANVYAACLLMPEKFMRILVKRYYHKNAKMYKAMLNNLFYEISEYLNVSVEAVKIRIEKLGLIK